jgi:hypothetical protein
MSFKTKIRMRFMKGKPHASIARINSNNLLQSTRTQRQPEAGRVRVSTRQGRCQDHTCTQSRYNRQGRRKQLERSVRMEPLAIAASSSRRSGLSFCFLSQQTIAEHPSVVHCASFNMHQRYLWRGLVRRMGHQSVTEQNTSRQLLHQAFGHII